MMYPLIDLTDPVALQRAESGAYTFTAKPDRLTRSQREALRACPEAG